VQAAVRLGPGQNFAAVTGTTYHAQNTVGLRLPDDISGGDE